MQTKTKFVLIKCTWSPNSPSMHLEMVNVDIAKDCEHQAHKHSIDSTKLPKFTFASGANSHKEPPIRSHTNRVPKL